MPIYDSSFLTQRQQNKVIARDFINRLNRQNTTSYGPLQGNYDNSILNNVAEGRQQNITKCQIGYQVDGGGGCKCEAESPPIIPNPIPPPLINNTGTTRWINSLFKYVDDNSNFNGQAEILDITVDTQNNIYAVGYYISEFAVNVLNTSGFTQTPSLYTLPATPIDAVNSNTVSYGFIIKYDTNGIVQWATYIPATLPFPSPGPPPVQPPYSTTIQSISIDSSNNIYVLGSYISNDTIILQNANGFTQTPSLLSLPGNSISTPNTFLVKYTSLGSAIWANYFTADEALPKCVEVDNLNNICITGSYRSSQQINLDSAVSLPISSNGYAYLIKYTSSGLVQWATYVNGTNITVGFNICFDSNNNIFLAGSYRSSSAFNLYKANGTVSPSQLQTSYTLKQSAASFIQASFLIKYDIDGDVKWATLVANSQSGSSINNEANANICDSNGNVYLLGKYTHSSFNPINIYEAFNFTQTVTNYGLPGTGAGTFFDCYLIKYDNTGKVQWAITIPSNSGGDDSGGITVDSYDNIYITGQYEELSNLVVLKNVDGFGQSSSLVTLPITGGAFDDVFIIKYSPTGQVQWGTYLASNNREEFGATIIMDSLNNLLVGGRTTLTGPNEFIYGQDANGNTAVPFQIQSQYYINDNTSIDVGTGFLIKYS
jgi:hypothetical protein